MDALGDMGCLQLCLEVALDAPFCSRLTELQRSDLYTNTASHIDMRSRSLS